MNMLPVQPSHLQNMFIYFICYHLYSQTNQGNVIAGYIKQQPFFKCKEAIHYLPHAICKGGGGGLQKMFSKSLPKLSQVTAQTLIMPQWRQADIDTNISCQISLQKKLKLIMFLINLGVITFIGCPDVYSSWFTWCKLSFSVKRTRTTRRHWIKGALLCS